MQPIIENIGKLKRRMTLSIPKVPVQKEIELRLQRLAKSSKMDGFRPGKVPLKMIRSKYGGEIETEVLKESLHEEFAKLIHTQSLKIAGQPHFSSREDQSDERCYVLDATFEVWPDIEIRLDELSKRRISRPTTLIGDAEIDRTLEVLRRQRVWYTVRSSKCSEEDEEACVAQSDDRVTLDVDGTLEGQPFPGGTVRDLTVILGRDPLPQEFETAVTGLRLGETKTFETHFPAHDSNPQRAGKTVQFTLTLKKVEQPHYPDINADFASSLGIAGGDLAKMRIGIKENLEREAQRRIRLLLQRQVMESLLACTALEVPQTMVEREQLHLMEIAQQDMKKRGMHGQDVQVPAELVSAQAERRVKLGLICAELIQKYDLKAQPEQTRAAIEALSKSYQAPEEFIRWYYADARRLAEIEAEVVENNMIDFVLSKTNIDDQSLGFEALAKASSM